jgi:hypothetical protein
MRHKRGFMRPGEGQKWGENGRKRVLQYFTWRKAAEQTLQIYEMLQQKPEHEEARVVETCWKDNSKIKWKVKGSYRLRFADRCLF